jgi:enoyl-[acyl-carrier protein] reductase/trans-2-enoyl-CoA reductase (NAD+)
MPDEELDARVVQPRMRGFIALESHPTGCASNVAAMVGSATAMPITPPSRGGSVVVLGSSTGYGLASAAASVFGWGAPTLGVCLERPAERGRTASAGLYNSRAFERHAARRGVPYETLDTDCFADAAKERAIELLRQERFGPVGTLVYSVASPVRTDPSGTTHRSVIKPIGAPLDTKTLRVESGVVAEVEVAPATDEEIAATVAVMGGEDWGLWIDALGSAGLLAPGFRTVAYTYVGPELTHGIYRSGTIGAAKADLEATALRLRDQLAGIGGGAWASVNGAAVTQASAAIPAVPLYLSLLWPTMAELRKPFQDPLQQVLRLFAEHLVADDVATDSSSRIRLDDWEMDPEVQAEVQRRWHAVDTDSLGELGDFEWFTRSFRRLFGFDVEGVDYEAPVSQEAITGA